MPTHLPIVTNTRMRQILYLGFSHAWSMLIFVLAVCHAFASAANLSTYSYGPATQLEHLSYDVVDVGANVLGVINTSPDSALYYRLGRSGKIVLSPVKLPAGYYVFETTLLSDGRTLLTASNLRGVPSPKCTNTALVMLLSAQGQITWRQFIETGNCDVFSGIQWTRNETDSVAFGMVRAGPTLANVFALDLRRGDIGWQKMFAGVAPFSTEAAPILRWRDDGRLELLRRNSTAFVFVEIDGASGAVLQTTTIPETVTPDVRAIRLQLMSNTVAIARWQGSSVTYLQAIDLQRRQILWRRRYDDATNDGYCDQFPLGEVALVVRGDCVSTSRESVELLDVRAGITLWRTQIDFGIQDATADTWGDIAIVGKISSNDLVRKAGLLRRFDGKTTYSLTWENPKQDAGGPAHIHVRGTLPYIVITDETPSRISATRFSNWLQRTLEFQEAAFYSATP
jgi:hypothetical protein